MNRLIILAALLLSVVGGLTLMSSSSPLAAQTGPSATRSFEPATVEPGGTVTVTVAVENIGTPGRVTETIPSEFAYVDGSLTSTPASTAIFSAGASNVAQGVVAFNLLGASSVSYQVTAASAEADYNFSGTVQASDSTEATVGGETTVTVSTTPVSTGPEPDTNDLEFDIVSSKAVKGARVSGVGKPIGGDTDKALVWVIDETGFTFDEDNFDGAAGDFEVKRIGDGKFGLFVAKSGASSPGSVRVNVPYTNADEEAVTSTLTGDINYRDALVISNAGPFTIPQGISNDTLVGDFTVSGGIPGEYLDGILSGDGSDKFSVNDDDMTLEYRGGGLDVGIYNLKLTVSGDAGLANRTAIADVAITVTASNMAPTAPPAFTATVKENETGAGLVSADTEIGNASDGVSSNDGDSLAYSLVGAAASVFAIDSGSGMIKVGENGIGDAADDGTRSDGGVVNSDGDVVYSFQILVSDGVTANNQYISATVTVDANAPPAFVEGAGESITRTVTSGDVPQVLRDLRASVSDDDDDDLKFRVSGNQAHVVHDFSDTHDHLLLTYLPPAADPGPSVHTITVSVSDGFNPADGADETISIEISVTEKQPPPITSDFVGIRVDENSTVCEQDDVASGCSLAGIVNGAVSYSIESGDEYTADDGSENYAVANDGTVTVVNAPDFEDEDRKNPAFLVNARNAEGELAGLISVRVTVIDVNERPVLNAIAGTPWVYETAQIGDSVVEKPADQDGPAGTDLPINIQADDEDAGATITYSISAGKPPFTVNASTGALTVSGALDTEIAGSHSFTVRATDEYGLMDEMEVTVHVLNANEAPNFTSPLGDAAVTTIPENTGGAAVIFVFTATDEDGDDLTFALREGQSQDLFEVQNESSEMVNGVEVWSGELHVRGDGPGLDYEDDTYDPRVHVEVNDPLGLNDTLLLLVNLSNVNDNDPEFDSAPATQLSVAENTVRGTTLANYSASDADGDAVSYSLSGSDADSFSIDHYGNLMTLESLDADRQVPCGSDGCSVTVTASDGERNTSASVRITVTAVEDSVSTLDVSKANPVPGTEQGNPYSALANAKQGGDEYLWNKLDCEGMLALVGSTNTAAYCHPWDGLSDSAKKTVSAALSGTAPAESPYDLPASYGSGPMNFVETEWANWGTVLRIEVTAESPDANCGNGNQCVVIDVNSDSADDELKLQAYRVNTPAGAASRENHYVAALRLVELASDATGGDDAVYKDNGGGVPALKVDEEDEVEIEFGNLRDTIDVENEAPEVSNFSPEHERAFDDADVDYTFTITDDHSGLPEPEDLPDNDGDADYTPVVALISRLNISTGEGQCSVIDTSIEKDAAILAKSTHIHENDALYCPGNAQDGEFIARDAVAGSYGFAPIRDDKDFDEIDNGYDVETTIVLTENATYYVTFIVCDNAGNCAYHDPDGNDDDEELAEITVDTEDPVFVEARTGLKWDSTDNEYDDDRNYIQVLFNDLTTLNESTVEVDDFVVEGHTIVDVQVFENPDDDDVDWADSGRYGAEGSRNLRGIDRYRDLENAVFIELADELLADETPDVTIVPNGVEDGAGNEQDDGDHEADDWISPKFTIVSITSTLATDQDEVLAGDGDEVTLVVMSDERLDATRPTVTVTYVNAPAGSVDTKGTASCDTSDGADKGTRDRGEIVLTDDCQDSSAAKGGTLNNSVEKVSNTEWIVTVTEPDDTGYYNFRIQGKDRSPQENPGSEGVHPDDIVTDFFDSDGDVNTDDAVFWEGDINLAKPNVRVSGNVITDNEPDIEYRSPLFVEIDFTRNHWSAVDCRGEDDNDNVMANCTNENSEYAEDNFDDVVITMFELDGVDLTDSVKTTDDQTFLVTLENVSIGDHTAKIQAMDVAGNTLEDVLEIDFEVSDRDPFERRLNPGWNLVSLPGEPADSSIGSVFGPGVEVRTVYTYDPVVPGGWMVAVRETLDSDWQGDLTEISGSRGYWVLSDAIQDWEVSIPRLAGGAAGTGTPIQPPVIPLYAGWNLIPVTDISGNGSGGDTVSANVYLQNLDDGLDLARVLGFDTIRNQWETVLDPDMQMNNTLTIGSAYWIFVREAASLVPSGYISGGGSD